MILFTNCFFFFLFFFFLQINSYDWGWEKNPEIYTRNKGTPPVWLPSHPSVYRIGGPTVFPGRKNRKQAGPALGGTGILIYRGGKEIKGRARYGSIQAGNVTEHVCPKLLTVYFLLNSKLSLHILIS